MTIFPEAVAQTCSAKKVFLEIWQNSQDLKYYNSEKHYKPKALNSTILPTWLVNTCVFMYEK